MTRIKAFGRDLETVRIEGSLCSLALEVATACTRIEGIYKIWA
jgi:hypothetical protein